MVFAAAVVLSMMWFTSDQHYGHRNIIEYCSRPFRSVEHMTEELIARHNARVALEDEVVHVGDFSLDDRYVLAVLPRLNGVHVLVAGNHDRCHPCHKGWQRATQKYLQWGFDSVCRSLILPSGFLVDHFPYRGDSKYEQRYLEYRPKDDGKWLLHGHTHSSNKVDGNMINVGVDAWAYAPVSILELLALRSLCLDL